MSPPYWLSCCLSFALIGATPAFAAPAAKPGKQASPAPLLGRENPYRPLIRRQVPTPPPIALPPAALPQALPMPPRLTPGRAIAPQKAPGKPRGSLDGVSYVGVAYDGADSLAAVQIDGKISFMRLGERYNGAVITRITRLQLVWRTPQGTVIKHMRHKKR